MVRQVVAVVACGAASVMRVGDTATCIMRPPMMQGNMS